MENKTPAEEPITMLNVSLSNYSERGVKECKESNLRHHIQSVTQDLRQKEGQC